MYNYSCCWFIHSGLYVKLLSVMLQGKNTLYTGTDWQNFSMCCSRVCMKYTIRINKSYEFPIRVAEGNVTCAVTQTCRQKLIIGHYFNTLQTN